MLSGCAALTKTPVPEGFVPFAGDARVWVEPGHEAYGARVAAALPAAIAQVEAAHYLPFVRPPRVYVCGSAACFARWVKTPKVSAAVVPDNRLILSPRLEDPERDRLPALLAHELAHLHLGQRIGHYHSTVPVWFHEGWASLTAGGGGAEYASDVQVFEAIRAGRRVDLIVRDTPDKRHRAPASRLDVHGFYRQSMLLVGWLRTQDPVRFRQLVLAIQDNADFEIAFWQAYGQSPASRLAGFFGGVLGDNGDTQAAPAAPISVP
ncbi:MAG: hypothetical protein BGO61_06095 [Thiobacillus sp. 65-69]|nr:MAG: hypothetical protein ABT21_05495 [Thiobacillus sp. SCN 65-179]OJW40120.1 MAG: hypothetical protein BGO61_06095 [Thiobacillus sp. 65-69]